MQSDQHSERVKEAQSRACDEFMRGARIRGGVAEAEANGLKAALQHYEESGPCLSVGEVKEQVEAAFAVLNDPARAPKDARVSAKLKLRIALETIYKAFPPEEGRGVGAGEPVEAASEHGDESAARASGLFTASVDSTTPSTQQWKASVPGDEGIDISTAGLGDGSGPETSTEDLRAALSRCEAGVQYQHALKTAFIERVIETERERDEWKARYRREKKAKKRAWRQKRHWKHNHAQQVRRVRQIAADLQRATAERNEVDRTVDALLSTQPVPETARSLASEGVARAICAEVSGLSPEVKEDVDDVLRALITVTQPDCKDLSGKGERQ